ncbi:MAG: hypothetical protein IB618_02230 [Candidatus Pacearchaeota archaeon]|nr:MAG: hypothetical protein IB618_02230 [Candidatus Pacearchaeota archaeon]
MREFIYFSKKARTSGAFKELMSAGRLDIACHVIIMTFFVSNAIRKNVKLHLFFYGPPDPPKHLEIMNPEIISKKDISGLIKRMLYKYKKNKKNEALPGCWIEKKSFQGFVEELSEQDRNIYLLDPKGEDIRKVEIDKNSVFIFGDHEGIPKQELRRIKNKVKKISIGNIAYFSSQVIAIVQNELDRRGID